MNELLDAIYEAPDDDGPRAVYADWLLERGDPRGELIASQIAKGKAKPGQRQQEQALLARHAATWVKPLGMDVRHVTFARGFPAIVAVPTYLDPPAINFDPSWSTVHTCSMLPRDDRCHVRALRTVTAATTQDIEALAQRTRPLAVEALRWGLPYDVTPTRTAADLTTRTAITALMTGSALPRLHRLDLSPTVVGDVTSPESLSWVWLRRDIRELAFPTRLTLLSTWLPIFDAATHLARIDLSVPDAMANPGAWRFGARITLSRDGAHFRALVMVVRRATRFALESLATALRSTPQIRRVRVAIATQAEFAAQARARAALEATCKSVGIGVSIEKAAS
jgi:uncharacterized protein (TIGR02996 family)